MLFGPNRANNPNELAYKMAPLEKDHAVYRAEKIEELDTVWWPLMQELGWDRGSQDLALHWHVAPNWPVVAPVSSDVPDKPVGLCVPFVYDNSTGWVGFFILHKKYRGRGWGGRLFQAMLDVFKQQNVQHVGLDAVQEQKKTYERRGFREVSKIKVMTRQPVKSDDLPKLSNDPTTHYAIVKANEYDRSKLVAYEESITGFRRSKLWNEKGLWQRSEQDVAGFVALDGESQHSEIAGMVIIRDCEKGYRIGPLYAKNQDVAGLLLSRILAWTKGKPGTIAAEVNMGNVAAVKFFEDHGWTDVGVDYSRMWIDGKATAEQSPGGVFFTACWAEFDAAEG